jgi:hypothetical protein
MARWNIVLIKPSKAGNQEPEMGKFLHDGLKVTPAPGWWGHCYECVSKIETCYRWGRWNSISTYNYNQQQVTRNIPNWEIQGIIIEQIKNDPDSNPEGTIQVWTRRPAARFTWARNASARTAVGLAPPEHAFRRGMPASPRAGLQHNKRLPGAATRPPDPAISSCLQRWRPPASNHSAPPEREETEGQGTATEPPDNSVLEPPFLIKPIIENGKKVENNRIRICT